MLRFFWVLLAIVPLMMFSSALRAQELAEVVPQTWQMLDYLASDYAGAVEGGKIISEAEYAEMQEFSATVRTRLVDLPKREGQAALLAQAQELIRLVDQKAESADVAALAHKLADALLAEYPIVTAPKSAPDLARGAALYQQQCASCHGKTGAGDGAAAAELDPPPIAFTDMDRADQRSPLSLYQTITQGVGGTSMAAYAKIFSEDEHWALAYYVGSIAYLNDVSAGEKLWNQGGSARAHISNLQELSRMRAEQLFDPLGAAQAHALVGYLRSQPQALQQAFTGIPLARARLAASVSAYQGGDQKEAVRLALSAYLDGVEPIEPLLNARDADLRARIELAMGAYRSALSQAAPVEEAAVLAASADAVLVDALALTGEATYDGSTIFIGAFTILLREGLEALLVVVAVLAFLNVAGRRETLPYVHGGWISALVAGGFTWWLARYFIDISGASRELTEGLSSLFAALVLLSVGIWMHQKSIGNRWQAYLKAKMSSALSKKSAWFLFVLVFVSVYREVFETILFFAALWSDGQGYWLAAGILAAVAVLSVVAWVLLRTSRRLPIGAFFSASSALIAVLAVVLTGKGVAALQEAGWLSVSVAPLPRVELLGMYPTWQTLSAQLAIVAVLVIGYFYNTRVQLQASTAQH
ncbi:Cytochrome c, class I:Iron permease FTR1 precursor [gamma proteobacterium HdN1]|nr:Cytochrome c, class I:Iron permease FTR1 precursor [gamma proteobacterium HdN1]